MRKFHFTKKTIPSVFFVLTILAYGLLLPWTGFYWDDWPFAWIAKFLGPAEFIPAFEPFRPFLGPIFFGTTNLLPPNPFLWQSFALLLRFALALSAWWMFKTIWPEAKWQTIGAALLFLVFPGYSQHWVALTHINQEWIPLLFYMLSFGFTAKAIRSQQGYGWFTVLALFFLILGVFPTEYFATQEPLRFLFLWVLVSERTSGFWPRFKTTLKHWSPYLLLWLANAAWLVYYYRFGAYASYDVAATDALLSSTGGAIVRFITASAEAVWKAGLYGWVQIVVLAARSLSNPSTLLTLGLIVASFVILLMYLLNLDLPGERKNRPWAWQALGFGLIGIVLGRIPSWAAGLSLTLQSIDDRFMVSMMIGGSLFLAGLVELVAGGNRIKIYILALLIALGVGQQFYTANDFRRDWTRQQEIFWQFAWRMPDLEPGTVILTHELPLIYETDMGLIAPLNWIYAPDYEGGDLPYGLLYTRTRLDRLTLPELKENTPIHFEYRTVDFVGTTSQAVTIVVPPNACLHVLDTEYASAGMYERYPLFLTDAIPLSEPSLILTDAPPPEMPAYLFGKEPPPDWCYYYTKAELARQKGDWEKVVDLGNEARSQGFTPGDALEWLPFIEGYTLEGNFESARELSILAFEDDSRPRKGLCFTWKRILREAGGNAGIENLSTEMLETFRCPAN